MENELTELTSLYALDILDEEDRLRVEMGITSNPSLVADLIEFRAAATSFSYDLPPVTPSPGLKTRLFERIGQEAQKNEKISKDKPVSTDIYIRSETIPWRPTRIRGLTIRQLYQDVAMRETTMLLKCEAGVHYPAHRHGGVEEILILEGDLVIKEQVYYKGDYIRSDPGTIHALFTETGCVLFIRTSLDNEFVKV